MSVLTLVMSLVLGFSLLCLLFGGIAAKFSASRSPGPFRTVRLVYVWLVAATLVSGILWFIGFDQFGSKRIPLTKQRRLAHSGYYFARDGRLVLVGKPDANQGSDKNLQKAYFQEGTPQELAIIRKLLPTNTTQAPEGEKEGIAVVPDEGFTNPALEPGEYLILKPEWTGPKANTWRITYKATSWPLRFQTLENKFSRCVNLAEERWLNSGDTLMLIRSKGNEKQFVSLRLKSDSQSWGPFKKTKNSYYFGKGTISPNGFVYDTGPDILVSEVVIDDGFKLSDLIRRAKADFKKAVQLTDEDWWSTFDDITLVREIRGNTSSRIGVFMADDLFKQAGLRMYRNYTNENSQPLSANIQEASISVPFTTSLSYGLGYRNSIELHLSDHVEDDPIWREIVHVNLGHPTSWGLPDSPTDKFIITSANDYIPLDGYFIDVGESRHAFFAKAWFNSTLDIISINDGKNIESEKRGALSENESARKFAVDAPASLGDFEQGVLLTLIQARTAVSYVGLKAIGLLLLGTLIMSFYIWRDRNQRPRLLLAWTVTWGLLLTILSVRLVLAYRAALVTPLDASAKEIQNVFEKALTSSLLGLGMVVLLVLTLPLVLWVLRWFGDQSWIKWLGQNSAVTVSLALIWTTVIVAWIIAGSKLGSNQAFLGARINTEVHVLLVLGLIVLAKKASEQGQGRIRWLIRILLFLLVGAAIGLQMFWIGDGGSIIYAISLGVALWLLCFWNAATTKSYRWRRRIGGFVIAATPLIGIVLLLTLPRLIGSYVTESPWLRSVSLPNVPTTTFYRFATFTESEESLLQARSDDGKTNMSVLLNNSLQNWQMLLYGSHGASSPAGYGRAPLSKRGMTYATSMTDCAFSSYLLAEHGTTAAVAFILLYVALGGVLVFAGWHLPDDLSHRNIPLFAIGTFFVCNALYMAAANVGLTVFTGQNIPLLGLYSNADLIQGVVLIGLAACLLLRTETETTGKAFRSSHPVAVWMVVSIFFGFAFWTIILGWRIGTLGSEKKYRADHDFSRDFFEQINKHLPGGDKGQNTHWDVNAGYRMEPRAGASLQEIERQYAKQFNDRADKFNPDGGLYYLERRNDDNGGPLFVIKLNRRYFHARSAFREPAIWRGELVAGGNSNPTLSALGATLTVTLEDKGPPVSIDLRKSLTVRATSAALLTEGGNQFCEIKRNKEKKEVLSLDPKSRSDQWSVFVDGVRVTSVVSQLEPLSIIVIERKDSKFRRNLIYLGSTPPVLSFVRWRNGEQRRIFPQTDFPLSYFISKALDVSVQKEEENGSTAVRGLKSLSSLKLSIQGSLHRTLQDKIARYAATNPNYDPYQLPPNRLGVTVIDAFSGHVLAVPSWPLFDPGKADFETLIDRLPESTRSRFVYNHNLTNHVAGSTIKPLVFGAMATQLLPVGLNLAKMTIFNRADSRAVSGGTHPHRQVGKVKIDLWDCNNALPEYNMQEFLSHSRDYPEGVIGMLGMITTANDVWKVLVPTKPTNQKPDVSYDNRNFEFDLTKTSPEDTVFTLEDQRLGKLATTRGPEEVNRTILFEGLASVFDFDNRRSKDDGLKFECVHFLPTLGTQTSLEDNNYIDVVVPGRMDMAGGDFQEIRGGLISCLLGGGDCGFNNVRMSEAAARLALGRRIFARMESSASEPPPNLAEPLSDDDWRTKNVITPMEEAGEEGTAASFKNSVKLPAGYRAIYKTGTILEGNGIRESETLMFVIGRWANDGFVSGETVAGYLYMEKSKDKKHEKGAVDTTMKKFGFAAPILNSIVLALKETRS